MINLVNDIFGRAINEAISMGGDDFEMGYKLISIVSVLIIGLFLFGLSKNKKRKYKPSSSFFR